MTLTGSNNTAVSQPADGANPDGSYAQGDTLTNIENVIGSPHRDFLTAGNSGSVIEGGGSKDILTGGTGSDTFVYASGDGNDEIKSFTITDGQDKIDLSAFTSIASLDDLDIDKLSTANIEIDFSDDDRIILLNPDGFDSTKDFYGLTADNFIFYTKRISGNIGDRFNNEINGGRGNDVIYGEQGRDIINGAAGDDDLYGGEDKDTFVFEPGNGDDYIMDWQSGDKIDLSAFDNADGSDYFSSAPGSAVDGNWVIKLPEDFGGGSITILGETTAPTDFIF